MQPTDMGVEGLWGCRFESTGVLLKVCCPHQSHERIETSFLLNLCQSPWRVSTCYELGVLAQNLQEEGLSYILKK